LPSSVKGPYAFQFHQERNHNSLSSQLWLHFSATLRENRGLVNRTGA
jgi:hypothetical protein